MSRLCLALGFCLIANLALSEPTARGDEIVTLAGTGERGHAGDGGPGTQALLDQPFGMETAPDGSIYFCEYGSHVVRRLDPKTGLISTVAGTPNQQGQAGDGGPATKALLGQPHELRFDADGNWFVSSMTGQTVRRIDRQTGEISTLAGTGEVGFEGDGGPATKAKFSQPISVVLHPTLGVLICDIRNNRIRRVDLESKLISTWAGTGAKGATPENASREGTPLNGPRTLAVDPEGNVIVVLREGNAVYRLDLKTDRYHHIAGTGKKGYSGDGGDARLATLAGPKGVALDREGNILLCDTENHCIRIIERKSGIINTLAGTGKPGDGVDGDPLKCQLNRPHGVFVLDDGSILIGDSNNNKLRKLIRK
ncbi:hypothetical protein [Planctomicrobium sp. SH664]|uniref:NHL domain-containing protein n=1 Tax=Planctomicrobium sp. SH664 TaxID=3448125 RepID=UPI003F5CA588